MKKETEKHLINWLNSIVGLDVDKLSKNNREWYFDVIKELVTSTNHNSIMHWGSSYRELIGWSYLFLCIEKMNREITPNHYHASKKEVRRWLYPRVKRRSIKRRSKAYLIVQDMNQLINKAFEE